MTDPRVLYADLLVSPNAELRMHGIERWVKHNGDRRDLVPLLDDAAPVVRVHGGQRMISEVRAAALVALQDSYRRVGEPWDLGPVTVRGAMPAEVAVRHAARLVAELPPEKRRELYRTVEELLATTVDPKHAEDAEPCAAYLMLRELGAIPYEVQHVDDRTWLTPLQEEIHASQMRSPRPTPHLRFDGERGPVGYVYRQTDPRPHWVLDFDEGPLGRDISDFIQRWMRLERGGILRVVFDDDGNPRTHPSGQGFLFDGVIPDDTDDPVEYLRSLAAVTARFYRCTLVE